MPACNTFVCLRVVYKIHKTLIFTALLKNILFSRLQNQIQRNSLILQIYFVRVCCSFPTRFVSPSSLAVLGCGSLC